MTINLQRPRDIIHFVIKENDVDLEVKTPENTTYVHIIRPQVWQYLASAVGAGAVLFFDGRVDIIGPLQNVGDGNE